MSHVGRHGGKLLFDEMLEDISVGQTTLRAPNYDYLSVCGVMYYSYLEVLETTTAVNR